jgi:hypothetical protein
MFAVVASACDFDEVVTVDPVAQAMREKLGPEDPNVPVGALHRPGQPCSVCHRSDGTASVFIVSGTVYRDDKSALPVADVSVLLVDARGAKHTSQTNCAGNFWVRPGEWVPQWPIWTSLQMGENKIDMESPIQREASCAACHLDPAGPLSAGRIFLTDDPAVVPTVVLRPCRPGEESGR